MIKRSWLGSIALAIAASIALTDPVEAYQKPQGIQSLAVPDYNVTIGVWAVKTPLNGDAIGVFEYRPATQDWSLCGICVTTVETPSMDAAVNAAGGGDPYAQSKLPEVNAILAMRYPVIGPTPTTGIDKVNQALAGGHFILVFVDGVPTLIRQ